MTSPAGPPREGPGPIPGPSNEPPPRALDDIPQRETVVISLLDTFQPTNVSSPHFDGDPESFEVLPEGKRSFANPWVPRGAGRFNRRVVWTNGDRHEWSLRSALTLPAPATASWTFTVPARGAFTTDVAIGTRVSSNGPVTVALTVTPVAPPGESAAAPLGLFRQAFEAGPVHKMKAWNPVHVDLAAWAGREVTLQLSLAVPEGERGYRYTGFFTTPSIVTRDAGATSAASGSDDPPNVLLLVVDAQRADTIGHSRETRKVLPRLFPTMETFVGAGFEFSKAFSVGNQTRLSTYAFLAGQLPTYGAWHLTRWNYPPAVKAEYYERRPPLITQLLAARGYRTAAIANNLFLFGNMDVSVDVGFDAVVDHRHGTSDTEWITESALSWLTANKDRRWFLMVNYNGPHLPYLPPKSATERLLPLLGADTGFSVPYLAEIVHTDDHIARLLAHLDALGLADDTLVVLTADHGEIMDERHQCYADNWDSNCLHNHGKTLYDEEIHVPLAFRWPGRITPGGRSDVPVSQLDLAPTLLGLLGMPLDDRLLGRDHSKTVLGGPPLPEIPILGEARLASSLRFQDKKYIIHDATERIEFSSKSLYDRRRGREELYDLVQDPHELTNLALACDGECKTTLDAMRGEYRKAREALAARRGDTIASPETLAADAEPVASAGASPEAPAPEGASPAATVPAPGHEVAAPAAAGPSAPAPAAPSASAVVWLTVHFHGKGVFRGRLESHPGLHGLERTKGATGVVFDPGCAAGAPCEALQVNASGGDQVRIGVTAGASLAWSLDHTGDGGVSETLDQGRFYIGPYGLCLLDGPRFDVTGLGAFESPVVPVMLDSISAGIYVWADSGAGALTGNDAESADDIDEEVRDMMKEWGYTNK
ncbi:MAG: sulfatase [Myxococcales bacterium]|nr:sulfatase [Myxococcales bacterium]